MSWASSLSTTVTESSNRSLSLSTSSLDDQVDEVDAPPSRPAPTPPPPRRMRHSHSPHRHSPQQPRRNYQQKQYEDAFRRRMMMYQQFTKWMERQKREWATEYHAKQRKLAAVRALQVGVGKKSKCVIFRDHLYDGIKYSIACVMGFVVSCLLLLYFRVC